MLKDGVKPTMKIQSRFVIQILKNREGNSEVDEVYNFNNSIYSVIYLDFK